MSSSRTNTSKIAKHAKAQRTAPKPLSVWVLGLIGVALIVSLGAVWYANTIDAPFYFDDDTSIVSNEAIKETGGLEAIWESDKRRTIPYLTFAANYAVHGLQERGYHLVNIAIHLAAGCVVFWLAWLLLGAPAMRNHLLMSGPARTTTTTRFLFALFAGLLFVSHPVQTQAVTYIVQRMASLAALFSLLALAFYAVAAAQRVAGGLNTRGRVAYAASLLCVVCAMFCKENTVVLPLAVVLMDMLLFSRTTQERRSALAFLWPVVLTLPIIPLLTLYWSPGDGVDTTMGAEIGSKIPTLHYLFTQFNVVLTYIRLLFYPVGQNLDYHYPIATSLAWPTWGSLLVLLALAGYGVYLWKRHPLASFGILFFFLALSVESSVISLPDVIFEHRMYLPMFGVVLAIGSGLFYLFGPRGVVRAVPSAALPLLLAALVLAAGLAAYQRNAVWGSVESLWGDVIEKSPKKARPYVNLGDYFYKRRLYNKALPYFRTAVALDSNSAAACNNLGCVLWFRGELDEAEYYVRRAVNVKQRFFQAYNILGSIYFNRGNLDSAEALFRLSLSYKSDFVDARANLGAVHMRRRLYDSAESAFLQVIRQMPTHPQSNHNLALIYLDRGRYAQAAEFADRARQLGVPLPERAEARLREVWKGASVPVR